MLNIDIEVDIELKEIVFDKNNINDIVKYILKEEKKEEYDKKEFYISFFITNNKTIKNINFEYRKKNYETDVLTFAYNDTENIGGIEVLGDIIISYEKVLTQAKNYNHSVEREFYYVLIHGLLHILGYDHINDNDKIIMREKEEYYLSKFNYVR